jgi:hypothetical protein
MAPWPVSDPRLSIEDVYFSPEFQHWAAYLDEDDDEEDWYAWQLAQLDIVRRGAELDDDLVALCATCHEGLHVVLSEAHPPISTRVADCSSQRSSSRIG